MSARRGASAAAGGATRRACTAAGGPRRTPAAHITPITMQQLASSTHLRGTGLAARRGGQSQPARLSRCAPAALDITRVLVVGRPGAMGVPRLLPPAAAAGARRR